VKLLRTALIFASVGLAPIASHAQGCAQCRDNTAGTPPATQRAYRHAIALLAITATGIFAGTVTLMRRSR